MPETLHLEFVCTEAERKEAKELDIHKKIGGGSKWLTWLVLIALCVGLYLRMRQEIPAAHRPYFIAGVVVIWFFVKFLQRRTRPDSNGSTQIEVSENEITIVGAGKVTSPWSAFADCLESSNLFVLRDRPKAFLIILPKRAFPDENSQNWFRELANRRRNPADSTPIETPVAAKTVFGTQITLKFRLGYRDYLDRIIASWRSWGLLMFMWAAMLGSWAYFAVYPPPDAVVSSTKTLLIMLPIMLAMSVLLVLLFPVVPWLSYRKYAASNELILSEDSINFTGSTGTGASPLTVYKYYKETRASFILWNPRGSLWLLLPKRAFTSAHDVQFCRALLARHLRQSRWFFG